MFEVLFNPGILCSYPCTQRERERERETEKNPSGVETDGVPTPVGTPSETAMALEFVNMYTWLKNMVNEMCCMR